MLLELIARRITKLDKLTILAAKILALFNSVIFRNAHKLLYAPWVAFVNYALYILFTFPPFYAGLKISWLNYLRFGLIALNVGAVIHILQRLAGLSLKTSLHIDSTNRATDARMLFVELPYRRLSKYHNVF